MNDDRESREEFGKRVRKYRMALAWDMEDLAERLGKSVSAVSRIETGNQDVGVGGIKKIARIFGVAPSALIDEDHFFPVSGGEKVKKGLLKGCLEKLQEVQEELQALVEA